MTMRYIPITDTLRLLTLAVAALLAGCGGGGGAGGGASNSTFSKSYGGPLHDEARVVLNTEDGGFLLFGSADGDALGSISTLQPGVGSPQGGDFWLQKLDANGNVEHSRTIGLRSPAAAGTAWARARPTADGGVVLAGTRALQQQVARGDGGFSQVTRERDFAVTKLDAGGNVVWSVSHDSGAWLNYGYFERDGSAAAAHDWAEDIWPLADGGFVVVGTSVADLDDRLGIGFPCDDAELKSLQTDHHSFETCGGGQAGSRFIDAYSVVVMVLNADGSLRWLRRLTDNPFDSRGNVEPFSLLVRSSADGGVVLARSIRRTHGLVHRLAADGTLRWRTLLRGMFFSRNAPDLLSPVDLVQTDDPVDGRDADQYDGRADDGFVLATQRKLFKLDAGGALQWQSEPRLSQAVADGNDFLAINAVTQHCDYGRPPRCDTVAVGGVQKRNGPGSASPSGFVAFVDTGGGLRAEAYTPDDAGGSRIRSLLRVAGGGSDRLQLLGIKGDRITLVELDSPATAPAFVNHRSARDAIRGTPELRADGSVLLLDDGAAVLHFLDAQALAQSDLEVGSVTASEVLRAAVQIGPGRFVLAGTRRAPNGQSGIVALRYDLDASGGRIVWQQRLVADEGAGDVLAAAPSDDGGVVLSLWATGPEESRGVGRLLKLDANGDRQWQLAMPGPAAELQRMPDGGFAALSSSFDGPASALLVTRVAPAGLVLWQKDVSLGAEQGAVEALTPTTDGGLMLVGSVGPRISLVRLAGDGALVSASDVELPADRGQEVYLEHLRIRQAADGAFVLAMTEHELLTRLAPDSRLLPYGQSNILVLKLDAAGQPLWSHVYGALFNEGVRDLALRADGTIALAGYSDSLGDRREAWLLKLSPQGLISDGGCQALLGSIAPARMATSAHAVTVVDSASAARVDELPRFNATNAPLHTPADFVTARQCLGDASAGGPVGPAGARQRLSVLQVGGQRGVVTSTPGGISCATGLDICSADFAQGSRVSLRADANRFVAWRGDCDKGSGGTALECVVVLTRDRTVQVEFGPPAPPPPRPVFALSFAVQGLGFVRADGGINCGEGGSAAACSLDVAAGTLVNVSADASPGQVFLGWSGETAASVCSTFGRRTAVQITVDRNLRCFAQFGPVGERLIVIAVSGAGLVRQEPAAGAINCREGSSADDCQEVYTATETLALRAVPDAGQRFAGWGGDCAGNGVNPAITLLTAQGLSCSASFVPVVAGATLTVQIVNGSAGGAVDSQPTGIDCAAAAGSDCSETYATGTAVVLRATLAGFQSWQGCDEVQDIAFCRVTMNQSRSVSAVFAP